MRLTISDGSPRPTTATGLPSGKASLKGTKGGRGVEETIERAGQPEKDIDELLSCQADMERLSVYLTIVRLTTKSARENQDSRMSHACRFTHSHIHKRRKQEGYEVIKGADIADRKPHRAHEFACSVAKRLPDPDLICFPAALQRELL